MSATITDYFNKASNMNGSYPPVAEVASARAVGGSVLTCDDLSGWATATPVHFSTFTLASDGTVDTSTQTDWKGIVVGNTITEMTRLAGAADSGNASGDKVELNPTIGWLDDLITGILVSHKQNGGLKDSVVTEDTIATGAVTSSKVAAGAISSYDKISDGVIQARNINYQTLTENLPVATTTAVIWPVPNIVATLQRIANIVTIQVPSSVTNVSWIGTMEDVGVKIPEGFRPIENTTMTTQWQDGTNTDVNFVFTPNGNSLVSQRTTGQTRWIGASCWITNDDWPSSS